MAVGRLRSPCSCNTGNAHGAGTDHSVPTLRQFRKLYSRKAAAFMPPTWKAILKASGFRVFPLNGDWKDLLEQLKQGRPLIASLQPGRAKNPATLRGGNGHRLAERGRLHQRPCAWGNSSGLLARISKSNGGQNRNWMLLALPEKAS